MGVLNRRDLEFVEGIENVLIPTAEYVVKRPHKSGWEKSSGSIGVNVCNYLPDSNQGVLLGFSGFGSLDVYLGEEVPLFFQVKDDFRRDFFERLRGGGFNGEEMDEFLKIFGELDLSYVEASELVDVHVPGVFVKAFEEQLHGERVKLINSLMGHHEAGDKSRVIESLEKARKLGLYHETLLEISPDLNVPVRAYLGILERKYSS